MENKFDLKTFAIACLLFFGFVFLFFYKFSNADDSINHYKTALEIFSSEQSFSDFKDTLPEHIIPEWYTESESMVNLLDTIACFAMGDYIQVGSNVVSELSGQLTGDPLFLDHFVFDYDSLSWVFDSDLDDFVKSKLDSLIYTSSDGYWYQLPCTYARDVYSFECSSSGGTVYLGFYSTGSTSLYPVFVTVNSGCSVTRKTFLNGSLESSKSWNITTPYTGSKTSGFAKYASLGSVNTSATINGDSINYFSSISSALDDFFGDNPSLGESSLIDGVSIRNEDFLVKPLSYPSSVMTDYPSLISYPNYNSNDYRLTYEYTYNMDVPFWLKNPTTEPISYELPTDYDFGNIEFEYQADPSYLAGAGIVQDVFDILPSSLQGLIALFGAGTLAFIFLRR